MPDYTVTYEARKQGAIGRFYPESVNVQTTTPKEAVRVAFDSLHRQGYETRNPIEIIDRGTLCICGSFEPTEWGETSEEWCPIHGINPKPPRPAKRLPWPGTERTD